MITPYSNIISVTTLAPLFDADYQAVLDYALRKGTRYQVRGNRRCKIN
jgi:predicted type IV restriction endonuclease